MSRLSLLAALALALPQMQAAVARAEGPPARAAFEVRAVRDVSYVLKGDTSDARKQKLDLYLPKGSKDFPVLFFVHGGGWSTGDRKLYGSLGPIFARNGIGVVIPSYRLSPQVQHPAHIEDVAQAFAWTHKHIGEYGGRADRIFVTGQSAGGHLTALLATDPSYLKPYGLKPQDIRGAIPVSGVYKFGPNSLRSILGNTPKAAETASPLNHVTGDEPPFLIIHAQKDIPACDVLSKQLRDKLTKNKVEAEVLEIKDRNHVSIMFQWMLNEDDPTTQAVFAFVAKHSEWKPGAKLVPNR